MGSVNVGRPVFTKTSLPFFYNLPPWLVPIFPFCCTHSVIPPLIAWQMFDEASMRNRLTTTTVLNYVCRALKIQIYSCIEYSNVVPNCGEHHETPHITTRVQRAGMLCLFRSRRSPLRFSICHTILFTLLRSASTEIIRRMQTLCHPLCLSQVTINVAFEFISVNRALIAYYFAHGSFALVHRHDMLSNAWFVQSTQSGCCTCDE